MGTPAPGIEGQAAAAAASPAAVAAPAAPAVPAIPPAGTAPGTAAAAAAAAQLAEPFRFYDSTRPWLIPAGTAAAALYFDGLYGTAGRSAAKRFQHVRWITVTGDAMNCGIADYEPGNPVFGQPGILRGFVEWRTSRQLRARVYVQRSLAARALAELGPAARDPQCQFWIPTADNRTWSPQQLAADLATSWGAPIPASQLWACQNVPGGTWDRSDLFGVW